MAISLQIPRLPRRVDSVSSKSFSGAGALRFRKPLLVRCTADSSSVNPDFDAKLFWKNFSRGENYNRKGFGYKEEALKLMSSEFTSEFLLYLNDDFSLLNLRFVGANFFVLNGLGEVVNTLNENGNRFTWGNVTVKLAGAYGFCWGVERAVQIAYEARKQFPSETIWITNEIIHNPTVNKVLLML